MRVIAGEFRSRRLVAPKGLMTRPTPDRLRESLFSILQPEIADTVFLDAYAGSGTVGIEALSRGASRAIFVENSRNAVEAIHRNLESLGLSSRAEVFTGKARQVLSRTEADIVFLDPPYENEEEYSEAREALAQKTPCLVIVQHAAKFDPGLQWGAMVRKRTIRQGENALTFYRLP